MSKLVYVPKKLDEIFGKSYAFGNELLIKDDNGFLTFESKHLEVNIVLLNDEGDEPRFSLSTTFPVNSLKFPYLRDLLADLDDFIKEDPFTIIKDKH